MALEKILVGDDMIDFAKKVFPAIPDTEVEFVNNPEEVIKKARTENYTIIVTDLMYTPGGQEGFDVLENLKDLKIRKILWTGNAYNQGIRERAEDLGAETLNKNEIGSLVGITVSKAPLKKDGSVLVYCQNEDSVLYKSIKKSVETVFDSSKIRIGANLEEELDKGVYGLVIDTTTILSREKNSVGKVSHDIKYIQLAEVPRVVCLYNVSTVIIDIGIISSNYYKNLKI